MMPAGLFSATLFGYKGVLVDVDSVARLTETLLEQMCGQLYG
jgi:heat shock protein HspQ